MPKKIYTPEQKKEKQKERSRNYQRKKTLRNRIVRYTCFLILQGYIVLSESNFNKMKKESNGWFKRWLITSIALIILLIVFILI